MPSWQQSGGQGVNEGPEILVNNGRTFLVYCEYKLWSFVDMQLLIHAETAAAGSWTPNYCLAFMGIDGGADPRTSLYSPSHI